MKRFLVACVLLSGCALQERFVKIDQDFQANSRADPPQVYVDEAEMLSKQAPPYRFVGVVEVEGKETEKLSVFYERVAKAGAGVGCEAMVQRDAFQGVIVVQRHDMMGRDMKRNNMAIWQFLCGVGGATEAEATATMKRAVAMAVRMRSDEMGNQEVCMAYTPTGSRVRKNRVCADDPNGRTRPDAANSDR
ncbi:MAG TPA: hypothetical protein VH083_07740 [Myxococcales bacterium]|nr:hypothetical protein [Myxococcales bacterium]